MASERIEGPTPSGGAYALWTYVRFEPELREVSEEESEGAMVAEYDEDGEMIMETVLMRELPRRSS